MSPEKLLAAVLLLSALTAGCGKTEFSANAGGLPPIPVELQSVNPGVIEDVSEFSGSLVANRRIELKSDLQGQVEDILVKPGSRVKKGAVLMTLKTDRVSPQLQNAQTQVTNSRVAHENAVQQLKVAESQREIARSNLELAKTNYDRAKQLVSQGAIGQTTADQAKNQLDAATTALKVSADQVTLAKRTITQTEAGIRQAEAQLTFVKANLLRQVQAPISGTVGEPSVREGESIASGQDLVTIAQSNIVELRLSIPVQDASRLRPDLVVELVDPDDQQLLATGKIRTLPPQPSPKAQTVVVKAQFPNPNGKLQDGQYVKARVIWSKTPGVLVPTEAVTRSGSQSFVFVVQDTPCHITAKTSTTQVERRPIVCQRMVTLGDLQGNSYPVKQGLKPGDRIAVSNLLKLGDDVPIQPGS